MEGFLDWAYGDGGCSSVAIALTSTATTGVSRSRTTSILSATMEAAKFAAAQKLLMSLKDCGSPERLPCQTRQTVLPWNLLTLHTWGVENDYTFTR